MRRSVTLVLALAAFVAAPVAAALATPAFEGLAAAALLAPCTGRAA